jgi:hypothetical protein
LLGFSLNPVTPSRAKDLMLDKKMLRLAQIENLSIFDTTQFMIDSRAGA